MHIPSTGTLTIDPSTACEGDRITVSCTLTVPNSATDAFSSHMTDYLLGNNGMPVNLASVRGTGIFDGIPLARFTAASLGGTAESVQGTVTLLY